MSTDAPAEPGREALADAHLAAVLVREAGRLAQRMRRDGLSAQQKTSISDVVTAADHAAEALVVERLAAARPDDGVLGEEGAARDGSSDRTWVIDPVDGTYNFVQGLTWWCSAVALEVDGTAVLGAVHHPHDDATYVGGVGVAPTRDGVPLARLVDRPLAESCLTTYLHPPWIGTDVMATWSRVAGSAATLRMLGSGTLDAMAVAQGQVHLTCQHSVPAWDWMPGAAIITALGGAVRHLEAGGVEWYVAGVPTAVAEACAALSSR